LQSMRLKIFYIIMCLGLVSCFKQEIDPKQASWFIKYYGISGLNEGFDVKQTTDGGYIIVGNVATSSKGTDVCVIKTDNLGNAIWTKTFGGLYNDKAYCIRECSDKGFIILGTFSQSSINTDVYLIKTDYAGDTLWTQCYGGSENEEGFDVKEIADGGFVLAGYTESYGNGNKDAYLLITNSRGAILNSRTYGNSGDDIVKNVIETNEGYLLVGSTTLGLGVLGASDVFVVVTNTDGIQLSYENIGTTGYDEGICIQPLTDESYMGLANTISETNGDTSILLYKITVHSENISENFVKPLADQKNVKGNKLIVTTTGKLAIIGTKYISNNNTDVLFLNTDFEGNTTLTKTYTAPGLQRGEGIWQTTDGGFVFCGSNEYSGNGVISLIKVDGTGEME
jgi:hypothetical protein